MQLAKGFHEDGTDETAGSLEEQGLSDLGTQYFPTSAFVFWFLSTGSIKIAVAAPA